MCATRLWWIQHAEVEVSKVLQDHGGGGCSQSNLGFGEDFLGNRRCVPAQLCLTLCNHMDCSSPGSSVHGIFPGKNTGAGCHFLLQVFIYSYMQKNGKYLKQGKRFPSDADRNKVNGIKEGYTTDFSGISKFFFPKKMGRNWAKC